MPSATDGQERRIGGRYRLSTHLGSGAMGTVWSGYDEVLQRRVAVKELKVPPGVPPQEASDMRERIMREARALGGLSHPNIITVYDVVDADGAPVVVLELVPSRNLAAMITEHGALTVAQAAVIGFTTAGALRAAHRSGITHRDVKPGNVLVADDGRVKLTDFGIARNSADAPMTSAGLVLGSPAYISPEVAAGQPVTPAADLWGLGATLFAAVEGRPPYDVRGDPVSTITEVVDGEVPRPRGSGPVNDVIAALMVKDPDARMPLEEVRLRLRPLIVDPDDPIYPGSPDAPTLASGVRLPNRSARRDAAAAAPLAPAPAPRPVAAAGSVTSGGSVPLAAAPGPLPEGIRADPEPADRPPAGVSGWAAAALVVAGAVVVLVGAVLGWTGTRAVAGQSPLATVNVTTPGTPVSEHRDALGFRVPVPQDWSEYRYEPDGGETSVSFVSPDGREELTVQHAASTDEAVRALDGATATSRVPDGPAGAVDVRSDAGTRTSWRRVVPAPVGVWAVTLTVPRSIAGTSSAQLFDTLADRFAIVDA